jgi:hypothetical protein
MKREPSRGVRSDRESSLRGRRPSERSWLERLLNAQWLTRRRAVGFGFAVVVGLVLVVMTTQRSPEAGPLSGSTSAGSGSHLAPIRLTSIDGERISLPAGRPGMLMFSTSTCVPCFISAKHMADYKARAPQRVDAAFIGVDPGDPPSALAARRDLIGERPFPFAIDTSGTMAAQYQITTLGTVIVYDAAGKIVARIVEPTIDDLRAAFRRAGVA